MNSFVLFIIIIIIIIIITVRQQLIFLLPKVFYNIGPYNV
jgi:hypothetical protein